MLRLSALCLGGRALGKSRKVIIASAATMNASHRGRLRKTASQRAQHKSHKATPLHELIRLAPLQSTQGLRELEASLAMKGELSKATINSLAKLPPQAHMVLLDCTHSHTPGHNDRIVSATLIAHIHQLLQAYVTRITKAGELTTLRRLASCPLLILVRTQLSREDAEVQQWVLRNALHMQPVQGPFSVSSKPVEPVVWVMDAKESAQLAVSPLLAQYDSLSVRVSATGELEASTTTPAKVEATSDVTPIQAVSEVKPTMTNTAVTKTAEKTSVVTAGQKPAKSAHTVSSTARRTAERREVSVSKGGDTKAAAAETKALTTTTTTTTAKQVAQVGKAENENDMEMKAAMQAASEAVQASLSLTASQSTTVTGNALAPIETEKELWRSGANCPVRLTLLRRVLGDSAYTDLEHKLTAKPGALHVLLIRLGTYSTVQSTWRSGLEGVRNLYAQLTGRALDDVRFFMTVNTTTATATSESKRSRSRRGRHAGTRSDEGNATMTPIVSSPQQQQVLLSSAAATNAAPRIVLLVHGNHLKSEDAAVFAAGLQEQYKTLTAEVQAEVLLDVQLVPAQRITERSLVHLLREGTATTTTATPSSLFTEVYERLAENEKQKRTVNKKESEGEAEALVRQSIWVAAMLQTLLRRHEAALRTEFDASVAQMRQQQADNEELSRAAQKVEFKAMMIDAVEEVSLRHEQATAHLVKTLSSMVGQWSAEKFVDGLESVIKEQLKPMHGTLETMKKALEEEGKSVWNECAEEIAEVQEMIGETQKALLNKMTELNKENQQREAKVQAAQQKASQDTARHTITSLTNTVAEQMRELKEDVKPLVETSVERGVRAALPTASALAAQEELNCAKLEKCIEVAVGRVWRRLRLGRYVATSMGTLDRNGNNAKSSVMSRSSASNVHITKVTTPLAPVPLPPLPSEVLTAPVTQAEMRQMLVAALKPIQQTMQREVRERVRGEAAQAVAAALERKGESAAKDSTASEKKD